MVTAGAMAGDFGTFKKRWYPLLTRVGPSLNSLSEFIILTLQWFGSATSFSDSIIVADHYQYVWGKNKAPRTRRQRRRESRALKATSYFPANWESRAVFTGHSNHSFIHFFVSDKKFKNINIKTMN